MKIKTTELLLLIFLFILFESCDNSSSISEDSTNTSEKSSVNDDYGVDDGNHTASIDYYNPETGHQATYEVTEINFNNGGWLDDSHFSPTELNSDGNCEIEDDRGREYTVHIDD